MRRTPDQEPGSDDTLTATRTGARGRSRPGGQARDTPDGAVDEIGRFRVLHHIGDGGMGRVYAAYDDELDRKVAVKLLLPERAFAPGVRARFRREAKALARLAHPNVVTVYEVGTHDDQLYIAMEMVEGQTLRRWQRARERPWREVLRMYVAAGQGLAAAHRAGIVHRDFKPDNVLVDRDGRPRVADFGLARDEAGEPTPSSEATSAPTPGHALTQTGSVLGTPRYMAPEQHDGEIDARSDQFSFCVALFEALYGEHPFGADLPWGNEPRRPESRRGIPPRMFAAMARGLQIDPNHRHASMDELFTALDRAQRRRGRIALPAVLGLSALGAAAISGAFVAEDAPCSDPRRHLAGTWDAGSRNALAALFAGFDRPYREQTWANVESALEGFASDWAQAHAHACEATQRGEQSAELLDLRMACLGEHLHALEVAVDALRRTDLDTLERAHRVTDALPTVQDCADTQALLTSRETRPDGPLQAEVDRLGKDLAATRTERAAGRARDALPTVERIVEDARVAAFGPLLAEALAELGFYYKELGRHEEARATLSQAYLEAGATGADASSFGAAVSLALAYGADATDLDEAFRWLEFAQMFGRRMGIDGSAEHSRLLAARAHVELQAGRLDDALEHQRQAVEVDQARFGEGDPRLATAHQNLGKVLLERGEFDAGLEHLRRGLDLHRQVLGSSHPTVAGVVANIAAALMRKGDFEEALAGMRRAIEIWESAYGPKHPRVISGISNASMILRSLGRFAEAEREARRAVELSVEVFGPHHPEVATSRQNLGMSLGELGRLDEARQELETALEIHSKAKGADNPSVANVLNDIGSAFAMHGQSEAAVPYYEKALAIRKKSLGADHPLSLSTETNLGFIKLDVGQPGEALVMFRRLLPAMERAYGAEHMRVSTLHTAIGDANLELRDPAAAVAAFERAHAIRGAIEGLDPALRADTAFGLARALWAANTERPRAAALVREARENWEAAGAAWDQALGDLETWVAANPTVSRYDP